MKQVMMTVKIMKINVKMQLKSSNICLKFNKIIRCSEKFIFYLFSLEKVKNMPIDGERKNQLYQKLHSKVAHLVILQKIPKR